MVVLILQTFKVMVRFTEHWFGYSAV